MEDIIKHYMINVIHKGHIYDFDPSTYFENSLKYIEILHDNSSVALISIQEDVFVKHIIYLYKVEGINSIINDNGISKKLCRYFLVSYQYLLPDEIARLLPYCDCDFHNHRSRFSIFARRHHYNCIETNPTQKIINNTMERKKNKIMNNYDDKKRLKHFLIGSGIGIGILTFGIMWYFQKK